MSHPKNSITLHYNLISKASTTTGVTGASISAMYIASKLGQETIMVFLEILELTLSWFSQSKL